MYSAILMALDGATVEDYEAPTVDEVWDLFNDAGSRWFFYPIPFVVRAGESDRRRIVAAARGFEQFEGCAISTVSREIAADQEYWSAELHA